MLAFLSRAPSPRQAQTLQNIKSNINNQWAAIDELMRMYLPADHDIIRKQVETNIKIIQDGLDDIEKLLVGNTKQEEVSAQRRYISANYSRIEATRILLLRKQEDEDQGFMSNMKGTLFSHSSGRKWGDKNTSSSAAVDKGGIPTSSRFADMDDQEFYKMQVQAQKDLMRDQDEDLEKLSTAMKKLKELSVNINTELGVHSTLLTKMETEVDKANSKLRQNNKSATKLLKAL